MPLVSFSYKKKEFELDNAVAIKNWLCSVLQEFDKKIVELKVIFISDKAMLSLNNQTFNHDYYTDVITLDYSTNSVYYAEIFISIDRAEDNAKRYDVNFNEELIRLMAHGVLHTMGFEDMKDCQRSKMKLEEDKLINMFHVKHCQ